MSSRQVFFSKLDLAIQIIDLLHQFPFLKFLQVDFGELQLQIRGFNIAFVLSFLDLEIFPPLLERRFRLLNRNFLLRLFIAQCRRVELTNQLALFHMRSFRNDHDDGRQAFDLARQYGILHAVEGPLFHYRNLECTTLRNLGDESLSLILRGSHRGCDCRPSILELWPSQNSGCDQSGDQQATFPLPFRCRKFP